MTLAPACPDDATPARPGPDGMSPEARQIAREAVRSSMPFKTLGTFGDFYNFVGTVFKQMFTRKFHFREFISRAVRRPVDAGDRMKAFTAVHSEALRPCNDATKVERMAADLLHAQGT